MRARTKHSVTRFEAEGEASPVPVASRCTDKQHRAIQQKDNRKLNSATTLYAVPLLTSRIKRQYGENQRKPNRNELRHLRVSFVVHEMHLNKDDSKCYLVAMLLSRSF